MLAVLLKPSFIFHHSCVFIIIILSSAQTWSTLQPQLVDRPTWNLKTCCEFQSLLSKNGTCNSSPDLRKKFPSSVTEFQDGTAHFILRQNGLQCRNGYFTTYLNLNSSYNSNVGNFSPKLVSGNYLSIKDKLYPPSDICLDKYQDKSLEIKVCNFSCTKSSPCVPVCCQRPRSNRNSSPLDRSTCPVIVQLINKTSGSINGDINSGVGTVGSDSVSKSGHWGHGRPFYITQLSCIQRRRMISTKFVYSLDEIFENATIPMDGDFCISSVSIIREKVPVYEISYCGEEWPFEEFGLTRLEATIYGVCSIFSVIFTFFGMMVYIMLWKKQTIHSRTQFCLFFVLFGEYVCITIGVYFPADANDFCTPYYFSLVITYVYFALEILIWLAILSFDLFLSFWRLDPNVRQSGGNFRRFYLYEVIGFVVPLVLVSLEHFLTFFSANWNKTSFCIKFDSFEGKLLISGIMLANLIFFAGTFIQILKHRRTSRFATQNASQQNGRLLALFGKLFLITGITFSGVTIEIISESKLNRTSITLITFRTIICLQGVIVFVVYLCNKKTWDQLTYQYPRIKVCLGSLSVGNNINNMRPSVASSVGNQSMELEKREEKY